MKPKMNIVSVLSALFLTTGLIAQQQLTKSTFDTEPRTWEKSSEKKIKRNFTYVQMKTSSMDYDTFQAIPSLSIGKRFASNGSSAADISISFAFLDSNKQTVSHYHLPKMMYIHYIHPTRNHSFYIGTGLSWLGIYQSKKDNTPKDIDPDNRKVHHYQDYKFLGISGNASIGYEFGRKDSIRRMVHLDLNQPFLPTFKEGPFPTPIIELSFGLGF